MKPAAIRKAVGMKSRIHFVRYYIAPMLEKGLIVPAVLYESLVKRGSVAASVIHEDAFAAGRGHDCGDELEYFVVFSQMSGCIDKL